MNFSAPDQLVFRHKLPVPRCLTQQQLQRREGTPERQTQRSAELTWKAGHTARSPPNPRRFHRPTAPRARPGREGGRAAPQPAGSRRGGGRTSFSPQPQGGEGAGAALPDGDGEPAATAAPRGPRRAAGGLPRPTPPPALRKHRNNGSDLPRPPHGAAGKAGGPAAAPQGQRWRRCLPPPRRYPADLRGAAARPPAAEDPDRNRRGLPAPRLTETRPFLPSPAPPAPRSPPRRCTAARRRHPPPSRRAADWAGRSSPSKDTRGTTRQPPPSPDRAANGEGPARLARAASLAASPGQPPGERRTARDSIRSGEHAISPWACPPMGRRALLAVCADWAARMRLIYIRWSTDRPRRVHGRAAQPQPGTPAPGTPPAPPGGLCRDLPGQAGGRDGAGKLCESRCLCGSRRCWPTAWMRCTEALRSRVVIHSCLACGKEWCPPTLKTTTKKAIFVAFSQRGSRVVFFLLTKHGRLLILCGQGGRCDTRCPPPALPGRCALLALSNRGLTCLNTNKI